MKKRIFVTMTLAAALAAGMAITSFAGWKQDGNRWYYYKDSNGRMVTNDWVKDGDLYYYMDSDGVMQTDSLIEDIYYVDSGGVMVTNAWRQVYDSWSGEMVWKYFGNSGKAYDEGMKEIDGVKYYFSDSAMATGWVEEGSNVYYFNESGAMVTGWKKLLDREEEDWEEYWYYFLPSGKLVYGAERKIDGSNYIFDGTGRMLTGWVDTDDYTSSGRGDLNSSDIDSLRYFNDGGTAAEGWKYLESPGDIEENWYYFKDGRAYTDGYRTTAVGSYGMAKIDENYYCFDSEGHMVTGLIEPEDNRYFYFDEDDGTMVTGRTIVNDDTFDNEEFYFEKSGSVGKRGEGVTGVEDGRLYEYGMLVRADDGMEYQIREVDGEEYLVNEQGRVKTGGTVKDADGVKYKVTKDSDGGYTITIVE